MRSLIACLLALACVSLFAQDAATAIRARGLIDVAQGRLIDEVTVVVTGGKIVAAGARADVRVPPGATVIDLPETILLPGLIDAHVHLTLGGPAEANARATLAAGFTTVQDLGAITYANIELRDAIAAGRIEGPRIVASGPWLGISGATCDFNGIGVRGADAFRKRVREDVARGADLIKVCVTGWLADAVAKPQQYEIADDELSAAIAEAHALKRRVAVHALSEGGIAAAVKAGADLVVHGGFASSATVAEMRTRSVFQLPTLFSLSTNKPADFKALQDHMRRAVGAGLPIAFGTDAGVIAHGRNTQEFLQLEAIGVDAAAALRTATLAAARAVGLADQIGMLRAGYAADVIGVAGNPLLDLRVLQNVTFVMKGGTVFKRDSRPAQ